MQSIYITSENNWELEMKAKWQNWYVVLLMALRYFWGFQSGFLCLFHKLFILSWTWKWPPTLVVIIYYDYTHSVPNRDAVMNQKRILSLLRQIQIGSFYFFLVGCFFLFFVMTKGHWPPISSGVLLILDIQFLFLFYSWWEEATLISTVICISLFTAILSWKIEK